MELGDHRFPEKLKRLARLAGIAEPETVSPYSLRHTTGTRLAESAPIHVAASLMKHEGLRMMGKYAHASEALMRAAVEGLVAVANSAETVGAKGERAPEGQSNGSRKGENRRNVNASKGTQ